MKNKEVQYTLGDDTHFQNIIKYVLFGLILRFSLTLLSVLSLFFVIFSILIFMLLYVVNFGIYWITNI